METVFNITLSETCNNTFTKIIKIQTLYGSGKVKMDICKNKTHCAKPI